MDGAWSLPGGRGEGVRLLHIEGGWRVDHPALAGLVIRHLGGGQAREERHGTRMLSVVASPGAWGQVGVAPRLAGVWLRQQGREEEPGDDLVEALSVGGQHLVAGDVVLVQAQLAPALRPVVCDPAIAAAARALVRLGVTVVLPAGNGRLDLDALDVAEEPGIVLVGAGSRTWPRRRMPASNHGRAVRVHAWGEEVATAGPARRPESTAWCGGTSAAAAQVAGVICTLQGIARASGRGPLSPEQVALWLSDPALGTPTVAPDHDGIGVMPDLARLAPLARGGPTAAEGRTMTVRQQEPTR